MKKFRMMLPVLAVVFAVGAAVAGDFFAPVPAYYKVTTTSCSDKLITEQSNCQISSNMALPICTILVSGTHRQAFDKPTCVDELRQIP